MSRTEGAARTARTAAPHRRAQLIEALHRAGAENSTATVLLHGAVAERFGLSPTDTKALEVISRLGPLTAGQLAEHTGLSSAAVTALIDRLEQKGFAQRTRDAGDRRRVIVGIVPEGAGRIAKTFAPFTRALDGLWAGYTAEELELLHDFLVRGTELLRAATARLTSTTNGE